MVSSLLWHHQRRFSEGLRCKDCGKARTNQSVKYCAECFKRHRTEFDLHDGRIAGCADKTPWRVDELGCMTRLCGDRRAWNGKADSLLRGTSGRLPRASVKKPQQSGMKCGLKPWLAACCFFSGGLARNLNISP